MFNHIKLPSGISEYYSCVLLPKAMWCKNVLQILLLFKAKVSVIRVDIVKTNVNCVAAKAMSSYTWTGVNSLIRDISMVLYLHNGSDPDSFSQFSPFSSLCTSLNRKNHLHLNLRDQPQQLHHANKQCALYISFA